MRLNDVVYQLTVLDVLKQSLAEDPKLGRILSKAEYPMDFIFNMRPANITLTVDQMKDGYAEMRVRGLV